jgi:23S rRNA (cytidine1920-2'-O)/16S rRNA (cytidine1409-2'-O)-methyltransferase
MRLDRYLVQNNLVSSRTRASECIRAGEVTVNGQVVSKPSDTVSESDQIEVAKNTLRWVSRGALKLLGAFDAWHIDVQGKVCVDIGASTGGFTQVLLEKGAKKVYAIDVGHGELHESVRENPRVVNMEGTHIKDVTKEMFKEPACGERVEPIECVVIDVSFISLEHVLPVVAEILASHGILIALIKPQFEVGKGNTKKGIVKDEKLVAEVKDKIVTLARTLGFDEIETIDSPIVGAKGNREFLMKGVRG